MGNRHSRLRNILGSGRGAAKGCIAALVTLALLLAAGAHAAGPTPLRLERTIPLPQVKGRIDHLAIDLQGKRLFVAALGNNSLEVIDLGAGQPIHRIEALSEPQSVLYLPEFNRLLVSNGGDGTCKIFEANSFAVLGTVNFSEDADNLRYYPRDRQVFVGYGRGALGIMDPKTGKRLGDIRLPGHPESFQLEESGPRIFVNVPTAGQVAVIDRVQRALSARWALPGAGENFPMALDEANHRLFIGCRRPARIIIYQTDSGRTSGGLDIAGDVDDLFYDQRLQRLYASCGAGFLQVFQQTNPDHYTLLAKIRTARGARTSLFVPEQQCLYLAVPQRGDQPAEVRIYRAQP